MVAGASRSYSPATTGEHLKNRFCHKRNHESSAREAPASPGPVAPCLRLFFGAPSKDRLQGVPVSGDFRAEVGNRRILEHPGAGLSMERRRKAQARRTVPGDAGASALMIALADRIDFFNEQVLASGGRRGSTCVSRYCTPCLRLSSALHRKTGSRVFQYPAISDLSSENGSFSSGRIEWEYACRVNSSCLLPYADLPGMPVQPPGSIPASNPSQRCSTGTATNGSAQAVGVARCRSA